MIRSMTAFAGDEAVIENLTVLCELRSVNHRYCDITVKLPERLRFAEAPIRSAIAAKIKRGKVECALNYKKLSQNFNVDLQAAEALLNAARAIESLMPEHRTFSALDILAYPGIQQEIGTDNAALSQGIFDLVDRTLDQMLEVRNREGEQLASIIDERCRKMHELVIAARNRMPEVLSHLREKLKLRIHDLVIEPDFDRLEQELVFLTQKLDVEEELDRLETHVNEVLRTLKDQEPVGRRLDFLMQEMNREANTLGSKSADKEMTGIAIDLKVLIEQMREQIQNIE
ncbi:YicC/YloC family endoribonuclease [Methylotuvimicrobium buryatense]|uniref:YicC family protein n=1 Tax=Methylotuvimicrobium buryatense TaxID=95641 RepID=A0A4P9ULC9_METBY|nr:YicC/YloC family endoribonuclease [Methylotuvimicrobium buryatense]QCW81163.1 YicC family protein [Methylotuvimicrobium buryatense]